MTRIENHPILGKLGRKKTVTFTFDNQIIRGVENEPIAAALLANSIRTLRNHEETAKPRGIYCNIGHCFECRVTVNGIQGKRACLTPIKEGMIVQSGKRFATPVRDWSGNHV
ncbi:MULTISPECIES: (2Fe-2S)-binding protein [Clostridia]|uniref:(2Fe-2S)-binding protein n=1 Tax=Clostridia TaxID=186801 RepID=UPI000EA07836|nr:MULTISPECIES: (2Fe-2S)-binding protein [Clostridia]NBJ69219.1 (2Fe-2S)-binding protein [Roseburia sp. 1XD42-34]RKI79190.1 (2Fe-2S)-binding protein [Clostridium sp. 1xD42-85]